MSNDTLERTDTLVGTDLTVDNHEKLVPDDGSNKDKMSHIAPKDEIAEAIFNGTTVTAICGHTWVPSLDPPKQYPLCAKCKHIYENADWKQHGPEDGEPPL